MDEKNEQIYKQYQLDVKNVSKIRGLVYIETEEGLYIIKPYKYSEQKANIENNVKFSLIDKGFEDVDYLVKNINDSYISQNKYGNKFVLKKWYKGEECNINSIEDVQKASRNLANFHNVVKSITIDNEYSSNIPTKNMINEYECYNNELKRVRKYIYNKKKKNSLEISIITYIDKYYEQGQYYLNKLKNSDYGKLYAKAIENKLVCFGNYNHHSVLINDDSIATINFDKFFYGVQIFDLYCLLRKAMEKNGWNTEMGISIIEEYDKEKEISQEEKEILYIFMAYPEKYRKLVNSYFNGKKSWVSIRITEKLEELVSSEQKKEQFLQHLKKIYGLKNI